MRTRLRLGWVLGLAAVLAIAAAAGCSKHKAGPTAPEAPLGPQVARVFPPARSAHILYNTAIWVEFVGPLDPASVNTKNVFLKVDTKRLPIVVSWDPARNRITITPTGLLSLLRTHTVELSANLKTADGSPLGQSWSWQFTTLGIRPPLAPTPIDRATGESPFASLTWLGTDASVGLISYDVFASTDSAALANHAAPMLEHVYEANFTPSTRWGQDQAIYWQVRTINSTSAESLFGDVWRFDPLPVTTPIDTVFTIASYWFYGQLSSGIFGGSQYVQRCSADSVISGGSADNFVRFTFAGLGPSLRLAGAAFEIPTYRGYVADDSYYASLNLAATSGNVCLGQPPPLVLPRAAVTLAHAEVIPGSRFRFANDHLTALVEGAARGGKGMGFIFFSGLRLGWATFPAPRIKLFVYHPAPPPAPPR